MDIAAHAYNYSYVGLKMGELQPKGHSGQNPDSTKK
jgi:hypothetical protein